VRESAARELGKLGGPAAADALLLALGDPINDVRNAAAGALKDLNEPLGGLIHTSLSGSGREWEARAAGAREELAGRRDPRTLAPVARALGAYDMKVRVAAANTLAVLGDRGAVEPLIRALSGEYNAVREAAALALARLGDARAVEPLIRALGDGYDPARAAAAAGLGELRDRRAVEPLVRALDDWHYSVRIGAASSLGKLGDARAVEPLVRAVGDRHAGVREAAVQALSKVGDARAIDSLAGALGDESSAVRLAAVRTLAGLEDRRAVDALVTALGDDDPEVRKAATRVLDGFGEPLGRNVYAALEGVAEAREELAGGKDPRAVGPLARCLRNPDGKIRRSAARALGAIGDRRAVDGLVGLAGGWNLADRAAAKAALFRIDQPMYPDLASALLRVASRPASLVYLAAVAGAVILFVRRRRRQGRKE
jgi:HEAT repeat protein